MSKRINVGKVDKNVLLLQDDVIRCLSLGEQCKKDFESFFLAPPNCVTSAGAELFRWTCVRRNGGVHRKASETSGGKSVIIDGFGFGALPRSRRTRSCQPLHVNSARQSDADNLPGECSMP